MSDTSLQAQLEALKAENAALKLKASTPKVLTIKVSEKGGVSVYGLGRFPVTLYRSQWEKLISHVPAIQAFIEANQAVLTVKEPGLFPAPTK